MKILEKITLVIYSYVMLIVAVLACLLVFGWLDTGIVGGIVNGAIASDIWSKVILGVSIVFILLSIKSIFFGTSSKEQIKEMIQKRDELQEKTGYYKIYPQTIKIDVTNCKNAEESTQLVLENLKELVSNGI